MARAPARHGREHHLRRHAGPAMCPGSCAPEDPAGKNRQTFATRFILGKHRQPVGFGAMTGQRCADHPGVNRAHQRPSFRCSRSRSGESFPRQRHGQKETRRCSSLPELRRASSAADGRSARQHRHRPCPKRLRHLRQHAVRDIETGEIRRDGTPRSPACESSSAIGDERPGRGAAISAARCSASSSLPIAMARASAAHADA